MTIRLHDNCRARLIEKLTATLPSVSVSNRMFLNRLSLLMAAFEADEIIPTTGQLRKKLVDYVDERPILEFIGGTLSYELRALDAYQSDPPKVLLSEIEGYGDAAALAERLVASFETLPWTYTFTIRLPESLATGLAPYVSTRPLTSNVRLIRSDDKSMQAFPIGHSDEKLERAIHRPTLLGGFGGGEGPAWGGGVHLQVEDEGYVALYSKTNPISRFEAKVRAFGGLALALQLCSLNRTYGGSTHHAYYAHRKEGDAWALSDKNELEERHARIFRDLSVNVPKERVEKGTQQGWFDLILSEMEAVFSAPDQRAERILLAAQWFFDSYSGDDELLSFVQAMVVLEILLGDKATSDEIGLGGLLRNRCAYLIGRGHAEREELLEEFNEIYAVRSQIVHRGKSKLNFRERGLFSRLHTICRRVIQKEVDLLRADKAS